MMTPAYMTCKMQSYHGARGMHRAARQCPPLAVAAAQAEDGKKAASLTFDVVQLARQIGWDSGTVKYHLKQTEWRRDTNGKWRRSGMNVAFSDLGLRVRSRGKHFGNLCTDVPRSKRKNKCLRMKTEVAAESINTVSFPKWFFSD